MQSGENCDFPITVNEAKPQGTQTRAEAPNRPAEGPSCPLPNIPLFPPHIPPHTPSQPITTGEKHHTPQPSLNSFTAKIEHEFTTGSAIAPDLYTTAIEIHSDTEQHPGGDVHYPIHDALNWNLSRFGHQARPNLEAAFLINEDGTLWQAKLSDPIWDQHKGKPRKYESPVGGGAKLYLPPVNRRIRRAIAKHYNVKLPPPGERFWGLARPTPRH